MKKKYIPIVIAAAVIVVGVASFFGGVQYQKSQAPARGAFGNFAPGGAGGSTTAAGGARRAGAPGGAVIGQIVSADAQSITVETMGSGSKIVLFSTSTMVMKTAAGSLSDLTSGQQVVVTGTTNSDGSVTAQSIQVRPQGQQPQDR